MNSNIKKTFALLALLLPFAFAFGATENITQINFVTEPRTVAPGVISDVLTVQTQNSAGAEEKIDETADIAFTSTSATGEFLGSAGNPVTTTMSKNTANRNFYYRDSSSGTHTLTVKITGRTSGKNWSANQQITVGNIPASQGTTTNNTTGQGNNSQGQTQTTSGPSAPSSHYSPVSISNASEQKDFLLSAGRERMASIHSPILFRAIMLLEGKKITDNAAVEWSFGDGAKERGIEVSHSYDFAGEYTVVVNARHASEEAVSRTKVIVFEPSISVEAGKDYVAIANLSEHEVNMGAWRLSSASSSYIFPRDTIILPKKSIKIAETMTGIKRNHADDLYLFYPPGKKVAEYSPRNVLAKISVLNARLSQLKKERLLSSIAPTSPSGPKQADVSNSIPAAKENSSEPRIIEVKKNDGLLRKLFNLFQ